MNNWILNKAGIVFAVCFLLYTTSTIAQVAINETGEEATVSSILDISSTDKGLLIPRMSTSNRLNISNASDGLMVFDSTENAFYFFAADSWFPFSDENITYIHDSDDDTYVTPEIATDEDFIIFSAEGEEAIYIDESKIYMDNDFFVGIEDFATNITLIANFPTVNSSNFSTNSDADWQSFTVDQTAKLYLIYMSFGTGASGEYNFLLYEGIGTSGELLDVGYTLNPNTNGYFPILFSESIDVVLKRGMNYTLAFDRSDYIVFDSLNPYPAFYSGNDYKRDYAIQVDGFLPNYNFSVAAGSISSIYLDDEISAVNTELTNLQPSISSLETSLENRKNEAWAILPVGSIQMWSAVNPPVGWLICDGSSFNSADYPELNTHLGSSTLPNFSGRMPLSTGNSSTNGSTNHTLGQSGGEETTILSVAQIPSHTHGIQFNNRSKSGSGPEVSDLTESNDESSTENEGNGQAHNNMPPFYGINFIIKAK